MTFISKLARGFTAVVASSSVLLSLTGCMTLDQDRAVQTPPLPRDHAIAWAPWNRLYQSVTVDYITGMDQHSYLFGKANQAAMRPMLNYILDRTGMRAPTPLSARYGLRVEFKSLQGNAVGTDFTASSVAVYRIVNRMTGETVYEQEIPAQFTAIFPGANENDLANVYRRFPESTELLGLAASAYEATKYRDRSTNVYDFIYGNTLYQETVTKTTELTPGARSAFIKLYQASIAAALFNEASAGLDAFKPWNFVAFGDFSGEGPHEPVLGAPRGALSAGGIGARNGTEREKQANAMMIEQSITKFVISLAEAQRVQFITRLPCSNNIEVTEMEHELDNRGMLWETDDCTAYDNNTRPRDGMTYSGGH